MKRMICLLCAMIFSLSLVPAVRADVIWIPSDDFLHDDFLRDDFLYEHMNECSERNASYITAGSDDKVIVFSSPDSDEQVVTLDNGTILWISYVYTDDNDVQWGLCDSIGKDELSGWIPMTQLEFELVSHEDPDETQFPSNDFPYEHMEAIDKIIEIKPAGPGMGTILSVVCVLAILSGGFLWITRKKK